MTRKVSRGIQRGAECPNCGSTRTYVNGNGYSESPEHYRLRSRKCHDCDSPAFVTAEVHIPGTSLPRLDVQERLRRRENARRSHGFHGFINYRANRIDASDLVKVTVKVTKRPQEYDPRLCGRGHVKEGDNVLRRSNGKHECKTCIRIRNAEYRERDRERLRLYDRNRRQKKRLEKQAAKAVA